MGRLTADPEHKQTPNGVSVTSFSIAVERNYVDKGTGAKSADFINIVGWRTTADFICKYFSKGRMIVIDGYIQTRNYEDRNGNKRTAVEVVADQVYFGDSKKVEGIVRNDSDAPPERGQPPITTSDFEEIPPDSTDDDLPF